MTPAARFWAKVDATGGVLSCWPWLGATTSQGYGRFNAGDHRIVVASRHALECQGSNHVPGHTPGCPKYVVS